MQLKYGKQLRLGLLGLIRKFNLYGGIENPTALRQCVRS